MLLVHWTDNKYVNSDCTLLDADTLVYLACVQYPRLFSIGMFSKSGPTRKQAGFIYVYCVIVLDSGLDVNAK